jgi:hypothetical protein
MPPKQRQFLWLAADGGWAVKEVAAATVCVVATSRMVYFARHGFCH